MNDIDDWMRKVVLEDEQLKQQMKDAGEWHEKVTFEEMCLFAGRHVIISEQKKEES